MIELTLYGSETKIKVFAQHIGAICRKSSQNTDVFLQGQIINVIETEEFILNRIKDKSKSTEEKTDVHKFRIRVPGVTEEEQKRFDDIVDVFDSMDKTHEQKVAFANAYKKADYEACQSVIQEVYKDLSELFDTEELKKMSESASIKFFKLFNRG